MEHPAQGDLLLGSFSSSRLLHWAVGGFPARSMAGLLAVSFVEVAQEDRGWLLGACSHL